MQRNMNTSLSALVLSSSFLRSDGARGRNVPNGRNVLSLIVCLIMFLPAFARESVQYCFRSLDVDDGLSQNTVYQILQDRKGFMWFGTKEGLNRYDGSSFFVYKKENSGLGKNFITALFEDDEGFIWIGTDGGVFVYDPMSDVFTPFEIASNRNSCITEYVTYIAGDGQDVWIAAEKQGLFRYNRRSKRLIHCLYDSSLPNVSHFWISGDTCWVGLYADNLYCVPKDFSVPMRPFKDAGGNETFKGDVINQEVAGTYNCIYIASNAGLTEINLATRKTRRVLDAYVRALQLRSDDELWAGTETGLYICRLSDGQKVHLTAPEQDDSYALSDNAIYSLCRDEEGGMWIGSYFGGVNYYPYQWTYFEKIYPKENLRAFGRRVREICDGNSGDLWIGTEDKGLFNLDLQSGTVAPFRHPSIYRNVHGLCLDGDWLWVGTFSGGLNRIDLQTRQVRHYGKGDAENQLPADDVFSVCRTALGDIWIGTTSGLVKYNRDADGFIRIPQLKNMFVYDIQEDSKGNLWLATYANGVFCYEQSEWKWKNYLSDEGSKSSLPSNRIVSIFEDSRKQLWFMTLGDGFCRYNPQTDDFVRYGMEDGFPNTVYRMVEDKHGDLWLTSNNGLLRFNPDEGIKNIYTKANGLLSNQFNFQSGHLGADGRIYLGTINGLIAFNPDTFVPNDYLPPVVITDFYLSNKRLTTKASDASSPLEENIVYSERIALDADQNSFSLHVAALSYQAPEMNRLECMLEGFDRDWYPVGHQSRISYSNLRYGNYTLRIRGSNSDGVWNPEERTLGIRIRPPFYLSVWAYALYAVLALGMAVASVLYFRKKTLRKQRLAMEEFERKKERELYTAKIDFFTNVAHEIRTPLTLIKSPLESVLSSGHVSDEIRDDLEIMDLNANRLLDLVNQLLDFRKTETQGFKLNFVECDVAEILRNTYKRFQPLARQKNLSFVTDFPERLLASVDKEGFTKIVSNLFTNAIKYSASRIQVSLSVAPERIRLSVCNDGPVVPLAMREEIFKPFVQYKEGTLRPVQGTGIGLPLARSLAELHGGTLKMTDSLDCNCFVLDVPLSHVETLKMAPKETEAVGPEMKDGHTEAGPERRYTVLVVEDSAEMRDFVARQLRADFHVLTACNGADALEVLEKNMVNIVVSDIMMPEMDGLELCERLKSDVNYSHIPVILLTAKTTLQARIEGMKQGADAYIEKPFSVEYLKVCVSSLLSNREKLRKSFAHSPFVEANSMAMSKADEQFLKSLNDVAAANMQNPDFGLDEMARMLCMSRSSLNRKIKGLLDMTPNDYIRLERLKRAAQLLQSGEHKINEVCYMTGFNTPSYFTKCFLKQFGKLPKDFVK